MGHQYVKESDTFSTSQNGTVPKPTAQEVTDNNFLRADGTWQAGGGSAALEDVTSKIIKASGIVLDSGFTCKAFKNDKIITLFLNGTITSGYSSQGTEYTLFNIDNSILPAINVANYAFGAGSSNARVHAYTEGTVKTTAGAWIRAQISWYIA